MTEKKNGHSRIAYGVQENGPGVEIHSMGPRQPSPGTTFGPRQPTPDSKPTPPPKKEK